MFQQQCYMKSFKRFPINLMSMRPSSAMKGSDDEHYETKYKSEPFSYFISAILFGEIRTQKESVWKGVVSPNAVNKGRRCQINEGRDPEWA